MKFAWAKLGWEPKPYDRSAYLITPDNACFVVNSSDPTHQSLIRYDQASSRLLAIAALTSPGAK